MSESHPTVPADRGGPGLTVELGAVTEAGSQFVALAEKHAAAFGQRAAEHDSRGSFPFENFEEMRESSFLAATVAPEHGGIGVTSLHDVMVGMSRLARGDASTAIAANMHITGAFGAARMMRRSQADGDHQTAGLLDGLLAQIGAGSALMCFPLTERGTDHTSPQTEATPHGEGYLINGRKTFGTISPAAQLFFPSVRVPKEDGGYLTATAMVPKETPGLEVVENWDSLGMRASGSNDITFTDCFISSAQLFGTIDSYGRLGPEYLTSAVTVNIPLLATYLGIAEAAKAYALEAAERPKGPRGRRLADRVSIQHLMAELEIDLATCRAMLQRVGRLADEFLARYETCDPEIGELNALMMETQCAKYVVNRKAVEVVDRALTICGGGAYMSKHPLARLYRDVRAGAFMQPFAPHEALQYIGQTSLGLEPVLDR